MHPKKADLALKTRLRLLKKFFFNLFYFFGCAGSLLLQRLFSSCGEQGLRSSCDAQASHSGGFSCYKAWALGRAGFRSCGTWTQQLRLSGPEAQAQ